jgi:hypothetical protein
MPGNQQKIPRTIRARVEDARVARLATVDARLRPPMMKTAPTICAAKSTFRAQRHRERERARLAGGEDWIRTHSCVFPTHFPVMSTKNLYPSSPSSYLFLLNSPPKEGMRAR